MKHFSGKAMAALGLTMFVLSSNATAIQLNPDQLRGNNEKNPVSVLQNRYFTKAMRPEVGLATGSFLNEAYTNTALRGARFSLFITEWFGVEVQSFDTSVTDSEDRKVLNQQRYQDPDTGEIVSPDPEVNNVSSIKDINAVFAPFYGKLNLMNSMILYSDLYLTAGVAKVETFQGDLNAITLGAGQRFYFLQSLSFRIDFRDRIYKETRAKRDSTRHAYSVDFGLSYFFF